MREISAIKKVPFDLPWISQQRTLTFGFFLNTYSVTLRRWKISSGFHTHPQKWRCGSTTNFYAKNVLFTNLRMAEFLQMIFTLLITFWSVLAGWLGLRRIRKRSLLGIATQTIKFKSEESANSTTKLLRTSSIFILLHDLKSLRWWKSYNKVSRWLRVVRKNFITETQPNRNVVSPSSKLSPESEIFWTAS